MTKHRAGCTCADCAPQLYLSIPMGFFRWTAAVLIGLTLLAGVVLSLPQVFLIGLLFLFPFGLQGTQRLSTYDYTWRERLILPAWGAAAFLSAVILSVSFPTVILFPALLPLIAMLFSVFSFYFGGTERRNTVLRTDSFISDTLYARWNAEEDARYATPPVNLTMGNYREHSENIKKWRADTTIANSRKVLYVTLGFTYDEVKNGEFASYSRDELAVYQALREVETNEKYVPSAA